MGRKLDALLGRKFKTSKLKTTLNLALSRLLLLKNLRRARFTIARSDVIQLLRLNHHEQALLRVEQVIKDQNMLDVYDMIQDYCHLLIQRITLIEQVNNCPGELKEAASSLLYAAPRCGEFPEIQEIRAILTSRFGKDFAHSAMELRSNCGVSYIMIQKMSPKQSALEPRMKMLTGIAKEIGISLQLEKSSPEIIKGKVPEKIEKVLSYRDAEEAAQDAFESAAYAAAAARAAVELARSESSVSNGERLRYDMKGVEFDGSYSDSDSDGSSDEGNIRSFHGVQKMGFDESEYKIPPRNHGLKSDAKQGSYGNEFVYSAKDYNVSARTKRVYGQ